MKKGTTSQELNVDNLIRKQIEAKCVKQFYRDLAKFKDELAQVIGHSNFELALRDLNIDMTGFLYEDGFELTLKEKVLPMYIRYEIDEFMTKINTLIK